MVLRENCIVKGMAMLLGALLIGALAASVFVWSGVYNIGADVPHWSATAWLMGQVRQRAIARHASGISVPSLDDPKLILKGAGQYAAMCTACHLVPGKADSEIRPGLYPLPPDLSKTRVDPQKAFWVIKHGIKMSAMPAWGSSHDDATIWSLVAFLRKLPDLSPQQYQTLIDKAPPDEKMPGMDMGKHGHAHEPSGGDAMGKAAHGHS